MDDPTGLVGEELNAVAFVMDYVEFGFNGPILRALSSPIVESAAGRFRFGEPGSRDALCALIGAEVASVSVREGDRIALELRGSTLTIPLDHANRVGPEAAHFVPSNADGTPRVADMLIW